MTANIQLHRFLLMSSGTEISERGREEGAGQEGAPIRETDGYLRPIGSAHPPPPLPPRRDVEWRQTAPGKPRQGMSRGAPGSGCWEVDWNNNTHRQRVDGQLTWRRPQRPIRERTGSHVAATTAVKVWRQ